MSSMRPCHGLPWCCHTSGSSPSATSCGLQHPGSQQRLSQEGTGGPTAWPAWGSGREHRPGGHPFTWLLIAGCLRTFPTLAVCFVCTLFFSLDHFYFSTWKPHFLTEGLRLCEVTERRISAHRATAPSFTPLSTLLPHHFLHWMEENQAMVSHLVLPPSSPFNSSPWEMSTGMNKDTN